jgi:ribosomal protein S18 acetylase RimI-like enzyme
VAPTAVQTGLVNDKWLSTQLERRVCRLEPDAPLPSLATVPADMIWTRVPAGESTRVVELQDAGFRVIDATVTLERPAEVTPPLAPELREVRPARMDDEAEVVTLAGESFTRSRFHLDPAIDDEYAHAIKAAWAASWFRGERGDRMAVAIEDGHVVGFLLALLADDNALVIDLVATHDAHRGCGIAADLTRFVERMTPPAPVMRVGTQLANRAAVRAYQKLGFVQESSSFVLHWHRG